MHRYGTDVMLFSDYSWQRLLLMWLVFLLSFNGIVYHFVLSPQRHQTQLLDREIELMYTEQDSMLVRIQMWTPKRDSLQELESIFMPIDTQQKTLLGKDWLGVITQIAQAHQVEVVQLAWVEQENRSESTSAQKIGFHVKGAYLALGHFYAHLLTLTHSLQLEQLEWQRGHEPLGVMQSQGIVLIDRI